MVAMLRELVESERVRLSDAEYAYGILRRAILEGLIRPGEWLVLDQLAEQLRMSRTPIREALLMLEADGLVQRRPKRGMVVRSYTKQDIDEICRLRAILEGLAAREAVSHITEEQLEQMYALYLEMDRLIRQAPMLGSPQRVSWVRMVVAKNNEFHRMFIRASRFSLLEKVLKEIVEIPLIFRAFSWYTKEQLQRSNAQHREIVEALKARDAKQVEVVIQKHLDLARAVLLEHI
jgi:DNA-binding GntR family transcriptional regulator